MSCVFVCVPFATRVTDKKPVPGIDNTPKAEIARGNSDDMWGDWSDEVLASPLTSNPKL